MAAVTHAVSTPSTSNVTSYASGAFTPTTGDLLVVFVMASATAAAGSLSNSQGITFHTAATAVKGTSADKMWCFVANSTVTSGQAVSQTVTFDCTGDAATGAIIKVARVSGMTKTGSTAVKQTGTQDNIATGSTPTVTLGASRDTNNPTLGAVANNDGTDPVATQPSGWTKLGTDSVYATPNNGMSAAYRDSGETNATVTWGSTVSGGQHCTIVIELDASAGTNASVTTTTVNATTTVPTPAVSGSASAAPGTVNATTTVPTPAVTGSASATPTTVSATTTVPTPSVSGSASVTPTTVTAIVTIPTPTVSTGSANADVTPTTVLATVTIPTPAVSGGASVTPTTVSVTTTVPTPAVSGSASVTVTTVNATTTVPTPAASGSASVTPSTVNAVTTVPTPTFAASASITLTTVEAVVTISGVAVTVPTAHKASEWGKRRMIQRGNAGWKYVNRPGRQR